MIELATSITELIPAYIALPSAAVFATNVVFEMESPVLQTMYAAPPQVEAELLKKTHDSIRAFES